MRREIVILHKALCHICKAGTDSNMEREMACLETTSVKEFLLRRERQND